MGAAPGDQLVDLADRVRAGDVGYRDPVEALRGLLAKAESEVAGSRPDVAVVYFDQAAELLDTVGVADAAEVTVDVLAGRGRALELSHRFEDARAAYETLAGQAEAAHNLAWKLASLIGLARLHATPNELMDPDTAQACAAQALDLARLLGDRQAETDALWCMVMVAHYALDDQQAAADYGVDALEIARALPDSPTLPYLLNDLHWVYATIGDLATAAEHLDEAIEAWDEIGNEAMLIDSLNGAGLLRTIMGDFRGAREAAERGVAVALRTNNVWNQLSINANLGMLHRETGAYDQALSALRASISASAREMPVAKHYFQSTLAILLGDLGAHAEALEICDELETHAEACPPFWRVSETARTLRVRARVAEGAATAEDIEELDGIWADSVGLAHVSIVAPLVAMDAALTLRAFERAIDIGDRFMASAERASARLGKAEATLLTGCAHLGLGSSARAIETWRAALAEATDIKSNRLTWRIQSELAAALAAEGSTEEAAALREAAIGAHDEVRAGIPRGRYRDTFDGALAAVLDRAD